MNRRTVIAAGLAATVAATGPALFVSAQAATAQATTARTATTRAATATSTIHWGKCPASYGDLQNTSVKCAALKVPLNYAKPNGKQITLEVSILPHTSNAANYMGYLFTNPGGPGGPGLDLPYFIASAVPNHVGNDYDWIGWDPRGVGASRPALSCIKNYFHGDRKPYDPTSQAVLRYWEKRSKAYAAACAQHQPALLGHMTTEASARDMESIRKALGVGRISYFGYSYGTYLGQVYATMFHQHLKRMVLDSNVDPRRVWYAANIDQDIAFNRNIKIYFRWVARYHKVYRLGSTEQQVSRNYYAEQAKLDRNPKGPLGGDELNDVVLYAGYYTSTWLQVTDAWSRLAKGHPGAMQGLFRDFDTPGDDNEFAVYNAVQCTDAHWPGLSKTLSDMRRVNKKAPFETWSNAWYNAPCIYWKAKSRRPLRINGTKTGKVLLIDETLDAATPYPGSLEVRKLFPKSSLIAEPGGTNHAFSLSGDNCVDNRIAAYLARGALPPRQNWNGPDYLCKPLPQPTPPGAARVQSAPAPATPTPQSQQPFTGPARIALRPFRVSASRP